MSVTMRTSLAVSAAALLATLMAASFFFKGGTADASEGDPARGQEIAEANCSGCHGVGPGVHSPVPEAPAFETLGQMWPVESLEEALAEGIMVGHEQYQMPVFQFTPEEVDDLIAYLKSIQVPDAENANF